VQLDLNFLSPEEKKDVADQIVFYKKYRRVFQYGTQQRSLAHIRHACELVRNGRLGKIRAVEIIAPSYGFTGGSLEPAPVPEGLDYEMWLGPAPWRPYTKDRCTEWGSYWCSDNAHGFIGGWGAHPLTDMLWALGDGPESIPVEYAGTGKWGTGLFDAPGVWDVRGKFANGADFHFIPGDPDTAKITGERGWIAIHRHGLEASDPRLLEARLEAGEERLYASKSHMGNFIECVRTRRDPVAPVEVAVLSDTVTQLGMIAIQTGRKIRWDPQAETIVGDAGAMKYWRRALREPWHL
jgi:predicted dehydrogenase